MTPDIVFQLTIHGKAQPAGSKQAFVPLHPKTRQPFWKDGRIIVNVVDANEKSKPWQEHVATIAKRAWGFRPLLTGPLFVQFVFYRERPDGHYGQGSNADKLKGSANAFPQSAPDVLKTARGVEDALTNVVWRDDALIVDEVLSKRYGSPARVEITVGTLPATVKKIRELEQKVLL